MNLWTTLQGKKTYLVAAALSLLAGIFASRFAARQATRLPVAQVLANAQ